MIALNANASNIPEFLDSLFAGTTRQDQAANVKASAAGGSTTYTYIDKASRKVILESWLAAWKGFANPSYVGDYTRYICERDRAFIEFIAGYIQANRLNFCKPSLTLSTTSWEKDTTGVPFYANAGFTREAFMDSKWKTWSFGTFDDNGKPNNDGVVTRFLWYFFHGAHFVVVCDSDDGASGVPDFQTAFAANLDHSTCPGNSHYATHSWFGNIPNPAKDYYYLTIGQTAPTTDSSYIVAALAGDTSQGKKNGFLQLEGWQGQAPSPSQGIRGGPRHEADFKTHLATLWNISTFGACAYSEKRSTPIFLAQSAFDLTIDRSTHMPRYDGAATVQDHWMKPGYLTGGKIDDMVIDVADDLGHVYFFQGSQVVHYDTSEKEMHDTYPRPISDIFPNLGIKTVDAVIGKPGSVTGDDFGTYYFFEGNLCVHYDSRSKTVKSSNPIDHYFPGVTFQRMDAAAWVHSNGKDSVYFFSGEQYEIFSVTSNALVGETKSIADDFQLATLGVKTVDAVEFWDLLAAEDHKDLRLYTNRFLLFHGDQIAFFDPASKTLTSYDGIQHVYGKHIFPGLWWK